LQRWPALGLEAPETQVLPPLSPSAYRDVIVKPAELYSQRVRRLSRSDRSGRVARFWLSLLKKLFFEFGADGKLTAERYDARWLGQSARRRAQCRAAGGAHTGCFSQSGTPMNCGSLNLDGVSIRSKARR